MITMLSPAPIFDDPFCASSPDIDCQDYNFDGGRISPFSLNNDRYLAPPDKNPDIVSDCLNEKFLDVGFSGQFSGFPASMSQDSRRSILKSIILGVGLSFPPKNFWSEIETLKNSIADDSGLIWSSFNSWGRYNFLRCFSFRQPGHYLTISQPDGNETHMVQKFNCGNKYCLWCRDRKRKKIAGKYLQIFQSLALHYGLEKVWSFVFTLPASVEAATPVLTAKLKKSIPEILKKIFNLKSRDNPGILVALHPVGDSDLLRDRVHFHVFFVPLILNKENKFQNVDLKKIDLVLLKQLWTDQFLITDPPICPQVHFFPLTGGSNVKKIAHRLQYDLRSFSDDITKSIVRLLPGPKVFILKDNSHELLNWSAVPAPDLARRVIHIFSKMSLSCFGWLRRRKSLIIDGVIPMAPQPDPPLITASEDCVIEMVRVSAYEKLRKCIVNRLDIFCCVNGVRLKIGDGLNFY